MGMTWLFIVIKVSPNWYIFQKKLANIFIVYTRLPVYLCGSKRTMKTTSSPNYDAKDSYLRITCPQTDVIHFKYTYSFYKSFLSAWQTTTSVTTIMVIQVSYIVNLHKNTYMHIDDFDIFYGDSCSRTCDIMALLLHSLHAHTRWGMFHSCT